MGQNRLTTNLQYWSTKQGRNQPTQNVSDEAETTEKETIEEKIDDAVEVGPVVDQDPTNLDAKPEDGNSSRCLLRRQEEAKVSQTARILLALSRLGVVTTAVNQGSSELVLNVSEMASDVTQDSWENRDSHDDFFANTIH